MNAAEDHPSAGSAEASRPVLLSVENIEVIYDHVILVIKGVSLTVGRGEIVALLGANGSGKTTTLKSISGLLRSERGDITRGSISLEGQEITRLEPTELVGRGCIQVLEGRHCFAHLTIEENLLSGAFIRRHDADLKDSLDRVYQYFPRLKQRRLSQAGYTSGGEQQMCAIGRALMAKPRLILLDEPSMGLAPRVVGEIFELVRELNQSERVTFLVAEQNTNMALAFADRGYVLESGRVVLDGSSAELRQNEDVSEFYLGAGGSGRSSFRDTKQYRRRKRWLA